MGFWSRRRQSVPPAQPIDPVDSVDECGDELVECAYATARGARPDNQDRCAISLRWAVLSDGAGGHAGGALAAQLTVDTVLSCLETNEGEPDADLLGESASRANDAVRQGRHDPAVAGMAATLVVAIATSAAEETSSWLVANVGDSRAWFVTQDAATQITEDDNVAAQLVRSGELTPEQALAHPGRNWITRAIGSEPGVEARITPVRLRRGEALLVASDGLDVLSTGTIAKIMAAASSPADAAATLVRSALALGSLDNVTAAVIRHRSRETP
jgi:protein phosphatase